MNVRTIAATLIVIGGIAAGTATASATPAPGKGDGATVAVCHREGNGSSHTITVANESVLQAHLRHGDSLGACASTATPTPSATPSATPTGTATPTVTPSATPLAGVVEDGDNDPCKNHPFLNAHSQPRVNRPGVWLQDTDCGQYIIETPTPTATPRPTVTPTSTPVPVVTPPAPTPAIGGPVAVPTPPAFDLSTIKALPKAGDGSLSLTD